MPDADDTRPRSDFDLAVADAAGGGESGLAALFRAFHPRLLRFLRARDATVADDIAAETWVAVARGMRSFEGDAGSFSAWLFTIARQRLADHHRTTIRRATFPVAETPDTRTGPAGEEVVIASADAQASVDFITRNLSEDQADVVLLRTLAGLTAAEIAAMLGRTETWVRVTHHRAMRRLEERIHDL